MKKLLALILLTALVGCSKSDAFVYDCISMGVKKDKFITITGNTRDMFREGSKFYLNSQEITVALDMGSIVLGEYYGGNGKTLAEIYIYQLLSEVTINFFDSEGEITNTRMYNCKFSFSSDIGNLSAPLFEISI